MIKYEDLFDSNNYILETKISRACAYARKSRPKRENHGLDEELRIQRDLEMQIERLDLLLEQKEWEYELYKEVKSGENIKERPEMQRLLEDIKEGYFDVLVVVDYDRLSRGHAGDQAEILNALRQSGVLLYEESTRTLYNPLNQADIDILSMKGFMANNELKSIISRNKYYKRAGARQGNWVNGRPPYGYDRNKETKKLIINEEQGRIYKEEILLPFLNGENADTITWKLNQKKIPSPRNKLWTASTVTKMLKNEVYCGTIIFNRTMGNRYSAPSINKEPYRVLPEDKWTIRYNCHPKLKTEEEHKLVMGIFKARGRQQAQKKFHALSGLVKCFCCGQTMHIKKENLQRGDTKYYFKGCDCEENRGGDCDIVLATIYQSVQVLEKKIKDMLDDKSNESNEIDLKLILNQINKIEKEIEKNQNAITNIETAWEEGEYTTEKKNERIHIREVKISELEKEVSLLQNKVNNMNVVNNSDKLERIQAFKAVLDKHDKEDFDNLRKAYYTLIDKIIWRRIKDDKVEVNVNFL